MSIAGGRSVCAAKEEGERVDVRGIKQMAARGRAPTCELSFLQNSLPPSPAKHRLRQRRASPKCPESCLRLRCNLSRRESSCFLWAWIELHVSDILVSQPEQVSNQARLTSTSQPLRQEIPSSHADTPTLSGKTSREVHEKAISGFAVAWKLK